MVDGLSSLVVGTEPGSSVFVTRTGLSIRIRRWHPTKDEARVRSAYLTNASEPTFATRTVLANAVQPRSLLRTVLAGLAGSAVCSALRLPGRTMTLIGTVVALLETSVRATRLYFESRKMYSDYVVQQDRDEMCRLGKVYGLSLSEDGILQQKGPATFFVAELESTEELVGFVALAYEPFLPCTLSLRRMCVLRTFRGHGIASLLVSHCQSYVRSLSSTSPQHPLPIKSITLQTTSSQHEALQLYTKHTFLRALPGPEQPPEFPDGLNVVEMWWEA